MLDHKPIFGKHVIETLSEGMYDNPLFLFREYVQNAADSIDAAVRESILREEEGQIEIIVDPVQRLITFEDNGTGIPHAAVKSMLANIGDSKKDRRTNKGFRGIGRLGGLGYCQKVRFETSAKGETVRSILEWNARNLHEILSDKNETIDAGELIVRITHIWEEDCKADEHFFKVSLVNVNKSSDELLDEGEVRKYLSMVAPVPFDYAKFPFIQKIEQFISDEQLPAMHEYQLNLNGDEVRKGYETPLAIGDGKLLEILDVECKTVLVDGRALGWYWFCVSKFDGVLPKKCWQRNIRLRKANIQIGEADCLSNHPKRGDTLWREDRGNNYFMGEIHTLDDDLIPNSRRDYFNQDEACRRFEAALQKEFLHLHELYRNASSIRSAYIAAFEASALLREFEKKDRLGEFYDKTCRDNESQRVEAAVAKAKKAERAIERIESKVKSIPPAKTLGEDVAALPVARVLKSYQDEMGSKVRIYKPENYPQNGYAQDGMKKDVKEVLDEVFVVLNKMLPEEQAARVRDAIIKRFTRK